MSFKADVLSAALSLSYFGSDHTEIPVPDPQTFYQQTRLQSITDITIQSVRLGLERVSNLFGVELLHTSEAIRSRLVQTISDNAPATLDAVKHLMGTNDGGLFEVLPL